MVDRRKLIGGAAAFAATRVTWAQMPGRVYRIGYLGFTAGSPSAKPGDDRPWSAFVLRLRELGFAEGANLVIEQRFAEGRNERYIDFAAEMVKLNADIVVASNGAAARAVVAASRTMPIVTTAVPDPVRSGLVASLARPGGQITGISNLADELVPKRLELLKATAPAAGRIAYARCPRCMLAAGASTAEVSALNDDNRSAARSLGVKLLPLDVNAKEDFDAVAATLRREAPDALLIGATQINVALRDEWLALAVAQRLPMLAPYRQFGAMLSYGPDIVAIYRRAAEFVVKILQGASPGDIPMEQPTQFEFVVNLQIAKSIGLTIPPSVLLRADEVIR
jgi:putative ABC transport system substrate-binding protein